MSKKILFFSLVIIFAFTLSLGFSALAEENIVMTDEVIADQEDLEDALDEIINSAEDITLASAEELTDIDVNEPSNIPTAFGLLWQSFKEKASLAFTFDEAKKAEKLLKYAEERTRIAELITEASEDPEMQEKATAMIEKASRYMEKIMEKKEKFIEKTDDRSTKLLENIAKQELNKERVLEKLEDKISIENLEKFQALRKDIEQKAEDFLNTIENNTEISDELKALIMKKFQLIQNTIQKREQIRNQNKELLGEARDGNAEAKEELQKKRTEILESRKETIAEMQTLKQTLIEKLTSGDDELKAKALEQIKSLNAAKIMVEEQLKAEVRSIIQERNEIRQSGNGSGDEASQVRAENQNRIEQIEKIIEAIAPMKNQAGKNN